MNERWKNIIGWTLIGVSVAIATALQACAPADDAPAREPKQQDVLRSFSIGEVDVAEFRDSSGRICVLAATVSYDGRGGRAVAVDCAELPPPLDYETLGPGSLRRRVPPVSIERLGGYEKRPL
jgi:hypothetical protein